LKSNIFITGFSGSGKSTVGREVARRLFWSFVDIDDEIERLAGRSIEAIFAEKGEPNFRQLEHDCLAESAGGDHLIVSTGGGVMMDERNRRLMENNGLVVRLDASAETIYERLDQQSKESRSASVRPMLVAADPQARIRSLKREREFNYTLAHWTVWTDNLTPAEVAEEVLRGWRMVANKKETEAGGDYGDLAAMVRTSTGEYPVWVGWGIIDDIGRRVRRLMTPAAAYVITDEGVSRQARRAQVSLEAAGIPAHMFIMPPGERNKNHETAQFIYQWLAGRKAERGDLVLAVGGGVVGDLAGFVAATYLRGLPFAQVPTTLLAMTDAAIGGKVAVDLPQGKNLVGAFYQPRFVLADVRSLRTLPRRELTSGWAEAIKHGLILDADLLDTFERQRQQIRELSREVATDVIRQSVAIKAGIVSRDERETLGIRILLNYGHTIGHAVESSTGYRAFLHGEAVSIGMVGSAYISHALGLMSLEEVERQRNLLESFGLPLSFGDLDLTAISEAMRSDKKTSGKVINWVLLNGIGNAVTRDDVPTELVRETLKRLAK